MKFIKLALISIGMLFLLLSAMALLIPSTVRISRAVNISATPEKLLPRLNDLRQWPSWNQFVADSVLTAPVISADSLRSGKLVITLNKSTGDTIVATWKNDQKTITGGYHIIPSGDQLVVQWYFDFTQRWYPWEKFASIGFDKQYGPLMENSLNNLKKLAEESN